MLSLVIDDQKVEDIFLKEFNSDKDKFFDFIKKSFNEKQDEYALKNLQIQSMKETWNNKEDRVWDEL